jgi:uncharacterized protein YdeI (BOF family)
MFRQIKFVIISTALLATTACTINADRVVVQTNNVETANSNNKESPSDTTVQAATDLEGSNYVINVGSLVQQQRIELYRALQKHRDAGLLSVVKDENVYRVRYDRSMYYSEFEAMIREGAKLDKITYDIQINDGAVTITKR